MRITELLKLLNNSERYISGNHSIQIFSDSSGYVLNDNGDKIIEFPHEKDMNSKLTNLWIELDGKSKKWEL